MAFAIALHPRLGLRALGHHLDDNMLSLICKASHLLTPLVRMLLHTRAH